MTEPENNKKTRRRFLADILFLGGGISAAGLLAQSQFFDREEAPPQAVGEMVMPEHVKTPCDLPPDRAEEPPSPGASVPPQVDGDYAVPSPPQAPALLPPEGQSSPVIGGKPVAPKHNKGPSAP